MNITKVCLICGKEFQVPHCRENKAKYCSRECQHKSLHGEKNVVCTQCGKKFHMKESQKNRYKRNCGIFCSKECFSQFQSSWFCGKNNHQYGLKGKLNSSFKDMDLTHKNHNIIDTFVYCPNHPYAERDRVLKHRLIVEQNHQLFDASFFEEINGVIVLKKDLVVHHKDGNHSNDDISNLKVMTLAQHTSHHNKQNPMPRNKKSGRFMKRDKQM